MHQPLESAIARSAPEQTTWRVMRLSLIFILDIVEITRGPGELYDPLILSLISSASVAPVRNDPQLEQAYATVEAPPPDELRRPLPVSAVARSLRLPYETVRRRVNHLVSAGVCELTPRGVVQPASAVMQPAYLVQAQARYERLKRLYFELLAAGALAPPAARTEPAVKPPGPPVRIANRLVAEYALRMFDGLMLQVGNPFRGLILLEIARATGEHVDAILFDGRAPMPDRLRRPVSVASLANRLRIAHETVRRHVLALVREGHIRRVPGGVIIAAEALAAESSQKVVEQNAANLKRLFARLDQLGVLAWWDAEGADAPADTRTSPNPFSNELRPAPF